MSDLKFALRQLLKHPGFTAVAVLTLALGIGANTVVFSVARTVLLRPLGYSGEDRLMWIQRVNAQTGAVENQVSWQDMEDIRAASPSLEGVATDSSSDVLWQDGGPPRQVPVVKATPNLALLLGVQPALGRLLLPSDGLATSEPVALVSHELWQSRFGGRPDVLGQTVRLDDQTRTIVGVLPSGLRYPIHSAPSPGAGTILKAEEKPFWIPMLKPRGDDGTSRSARMFLGVARLRPGIRLETARAELAGLSQRLTQEFPESNRHWRFEVLSFRSQVFGRTLQGVPLLIGAVAVVLLICCVNLANLLLARGVSRQRELAVRLALGAGRTRLVRAALMESVLLSLLGGTAGAAVAHGTIRVLHRLASGTVPFIGEVAVDGPGILFTAGISLLTTLAFGLLPALRQSGGNASDALRSGTRATGGPQVRRWQQGLLTVQIAVVLVLLASAALLLESFRRLVGQDLGYQPRSVVTLDLGTPGFDTNGDVCRMYRALRDRIAALPGVEHVGTVSSVPLTGKWTFKERPEVVGRPLPEAERPEVAATFVAFDYFQALGIPLREGRFFRDGELKDDGYGQVVLLNEAAARVLFPNGSAVGGRFTVGSNPDRVLEVVGVVKDTRDVRLEDRPQPRFYWQYAFGGAQVVVRARTPAPVLIPMLRGAVTQTDSRVQVEGVRSLEEIVAGTVAERRFLMTLVTSYAALALGLAVVGIFGVVACQVAQRTDEFGIRLALGASPAGLVRLVLAQALRVVAVGVATGLVLSLGTGRLLASELFELSPQDPRLLGGIGLLTVITALLASAWPARQA
ncbi:MAG: ABC transporter permease, partial [Verrucomicrobia bacterium]|nr:ABC transporter permease [Verrucomicrobiota bacterium]